MLPYKLTEQSKTIFPVLPVPLILPFKIIPDYFHNSALTITLNQIFKNEMEAGDLDFLEGRSISINIHDAEVVYRITLSEGRLKTHGGKSKCDLSIQANFYDFLTIVSRQEDADTLVFQRRLVMEGDTELGLSLKNYLDGVDIDSSKLLLFIEKLSRRALPVYERMFG